jgi:integrase
MAKYQRTRRRANREGSLYFVPAENRWRGVVTWTDPTGRQHRRYVSAKTQTAVRKRIAQLTADLENGLTPAPTGSVAAYLAAWLERLRQHVKPATWRQREQFIRLYVVPTIGSVALAKLTPSDVERMTAWIIETGRSPRTAAHTRVILRRALADAQRDGHVHRNVAALARAPRVERRAIEPGRDYLIPAQLSRLQAVAVEYRVGALVTLAARTGMRQGELLGLAWDDVDLEGARLTVRRAMVRSWDGGTELAAPKTRASQRTIPLSPAAVEALRREQREQDEARQAVASDWQDRDNLVFTDAIGRPLYRTAIHRGYHELLEAAGLPAVPFHGLRHSAATAWLSEGVALSVVSDLLGHAGIGITKDTYGHVTPELRETAREAMERLEGGGTS